MSNQQQGPPYAGFSDHIRGIQEDRAAEKAGISKDAVKALNDTVADLRVHLEEPRTLRRLVGIAPPLQTAVVQIIAAIFRPTGERAIGVSGVRGDKEQFELWQQGREKPGKIVTHLDGVKKRSRHQVAVDGPWKGTGCAVDVCFLDDKCNACWDDTMPWALLGTLAKANGLVWGGDWPKLRDRPHLEMFDA